MKTRATFNTTWGSWGEGVFEKIYASLQVKKKIGYLFSIWKVFRSNKKDMYNQNQVVKLRLASLKNNNNN